MTNKGNTTPKRFKGKAVTVGDLTMNLKAWASYLKIAPCQISSKVALLGSHEKSIIFFMDAEQRGTAEYEYTGAEFTAASGKTIRPGDKHTLSRWPGELGMNERTFRTRISKINMPDQDKFNLAINKPIMIGRGESKLIAKFRKNKKKILSPASVATQTQGMTQIEMLLCRLDRQDTGCAGCKSRMNCYGK